MRDQNYPAIGRQPQSLPFLPFARTQSSDDLGNAQHRFAVTRLDCSRVLAFRIHAGLQAGRCRCTSSVIMAERRPLTELEQRSFLKVVRRLSPRNRALATAQWLTGFRISEILSLTIGSVYREGKMLPKIGVRPRNLKGHYGTTRWVPVLPELSRALESHLACLRRRYELIPDLPLFLSRQDNADGTARPLCRESARKIIRAAFTTAGIEDDGRLGTHSLRKTFARRVYENSGHDLLVLKKALGHSDVQVTQKYLEVSEDEVMAAMSRVDFTRGPQKRNVGGAGEALPTGIHSDKTAAASLFQAATPNVPLDRPAA